MKKAKLFKSGGSLAVRLPKSWIRGGDVVHLSKQGDSIVITPENNKLLGLAEKFRKDGVIDFERLKQPKTPSIRELSQTFQTPSKVQAINS
jgi:virulence-associated protein VagC